MKKKIVYLYGIFFISLFIILFSINFFYKKFITNLQVGNEYFVTAYQFYDFKSSSKNKLFDKIFIVDGYDSIINSKKIYRIKNLNKEEFSFTLDNPKTFINFVLLTRDYFDEKELENKINDTYIGALTEIINEIENNKILFNYEDAKEEIFEEKRSVINKAYERLVNSQFYKKYPPQVQCIYDKKELCLGLYSNYYNQIFKRLNSDEISHSFLRNFTTIDIEKETIVYEILNDFYQNVPLFDYPFFSFEKNSFTLEFIKFKKRYEKLIKSDFFIKYSPHNYCQLYSSGCFREISDYFNLILARHKREINHKFNVKIIKTKNAFNFFVEAPTIFGLTAIITYIFFILTNKFFIRKLK